MSYEIGDKVFILAKRMEGGSSSVSPESAQAPSYPIVECVVTQVDVCGIEGCYGLVWADTEEPIGLPFYERSMFPTEEALKERVEACQVPL